MKDILKKISRVFGFELIEKVQFEKLVEFEKDLYEVLESLSRSHLVERNNTAQLFQDMIVLLESNFKKGGFFVEFGATDGVNLSNTYMLEKKYGWRGILAEPAKVWHERLTENRNAHIDFRCVWRASGERLPFKVSDFPEYSTINLYENCDHHSDTRKDGVYYEVETVSLNDLLRDYDAPKNIDYLSVDTEGSELEIIRSFDFDEYDISVISCEHNYTEDREELASFLGNKGYKRKYTGLSKWDDWYFK